MSTGLDEPQAQLERLLAEQAALRRVATIVARESTSQPEVFAAITQELGRLMDVDHVRMWRFDDDAMATAVATAGAFEDAMPVGARVALDEDSLAGQVHRARQSRRIDDYTRISGRIAERAEEIGVGGAVGTPIVVGDRLWGAMVAASRRPGRLPADAEKRMDEFTELLATAIANSNAREELRTLAGVQAALRRVATLAAQGVQPGDLFSAVAEEVAGLLPVTSAAMGRFEPDGTVTTVAAWSPGRVVFPVGLRRDPRGNNVTGIVFETGRPARLDDFTDASGPIGVRARESGYRSAVASPILVDGRLWGVMSAASTAATRLPAETEIRLASFTELVATAIANSESRSGLARLVDEQAALRRVATLVAQGAQPAEVFSAVGDEVGRLFGSEVVAFAAAAEEPGAVPIVVAGHVWGAIRVSDTEPLPPGAEHRLEEFTTLLGIAIANADNRQQLTASRARLVAAEDAARRGVVRDLHDGAQQRLVHSIVLLKQARRILRERSGDAEPLVADALEQAERSNEELRELAHGILPVALTRGGLRVAVRSLMSRLDISVEDDVPSDRFAEEIEATAYFTIAEALTNVVKHANASHARVRAAVENGTLHVEIRDDGAGGADRSGPGLVGMDDRVSALGGRLEVTSATGDGTRVTIALPLR